MILDKLLSKVNYNIYRAKYRYGQFLPLKVPVDIALELAGQCNQKCTYCYFAEDNKDTLPFKTGMMKFETAQKIISQASDLGVNSLKFNYRGESTMNPHFYQITKFAKDLSSGSTFIDRLTNSNFKFRNDKDDIFDGLCNQTKVKISYDSFIKDVFETQRAGGDHDLTTRNIDKFYNYRNRKDTEIVIQAVRTRLNKNEDIEGSVKKRWPSASLSIRDVVEGRKENNIDDLVNKVRDNSNRKPCLQAYVRLIFTWDGRATVCCPSISEDLIVGDINKISLGEIFNSKKAKFIRKKLKTKEAFSIYSSCKNCSSFESYSGYTPSWVS